MTEYEVRRFDERLEVADGEELVEAQLSTKGTLPQHTAHSNLALVELADEYVCGFETSSGECGREVDAPDETCWQHPDA
jgi:hypothetical protein